MALRARKVSGSLEKRAPGLLFCPSVETFLQHKFFRWDSAVDRFLFLLTMSSSSSDSEMSFDSENSEIYYIAEENDRSRLSTSQTE